MSNQSITIDFPINFSLHFYIFLLALKSQRALASGRTKAVNIVRQKFDNFKSPDLIAISGRGLD